MTHSIARQRLKRNTQERNMPCTHYKHYKLVSHKRYGKTHHLTPTTKTL